MVADRHNRPHPPALPGWAQRSAHQPAAWRKTGRQHCPPESPWNNGCTAWRRYLATEGRTRKLPEKGRRRLSLQRTASPRLRATAHFSGSACDAGVTPRECPCHTARRAGHGSRFHRNAATKHRKAAQRNRMCEVAIDSGGAGSLRAPRCRRRLGAAQCASRR